MREGRRPPVQGPVTVWRRAGDTSPMQNPLVKYIFYTLLHFEYAEDKSLSNLARHGMD